jgi:serine/threonine protein kinase
MRAVTRLRHPNVVSAFDDNPIGATHFYAMEFVEGTDLHKLVQLTGALPVGQACDFVRQAALGLQHAHEHHLVHRDIKPANLVRIGDSSLVKILDFGLTRLRSAPGQAGVSEAVTREGVMIGTADYVSPEQSRDARTVDIRADIYSLGCTFYYLLAGRVPFSGGSLLEKVYKHLNAAAQPVHEVRPEVPVEVSAVVQRMMAKQPGDRYQTPAEVAGAVEGIANS